MRLRQGYHWHPRPWRPSAQQRRVLDLLLEGRTNPEIAACLGITLDGAKWHVSQLLAETGCERRQDLAAWWRQERERRPEPRAALAPLLGLIRHAPPLAAVLTTAGAIVVVSLLAIRFGIGAGAGPSAGERGASAAPVSASAAPAPTHTPTPTPQPASPGAWAFDVAAESVTPLPMLLGFRQWLRQEPAAFLGRGAGEDVVVNAFGATIARIPSGGASQGRPLTVALQDEGTVLLWWPSEGVLRVLDPVTHAESSRASFGVTPGAGGAFDRPWAITATGRAIALAEPRGDRTIVATYALSGSGRKVIYESGIDTRVSKLVWSPDGRRLLILTGRRPLSPRDSITPDSLVVVEISGAVVLRQAMEAGSYGWAGPRHLLFEPASTTASRRPPTLIDVEDGSRSDGPSAAGLLCISPDGRLGVYLHEQTRPGSAAPVTRHQVKDLASGDVLAEAETSSVATACDWTWDSRRVVVSPGGK
jgi:DNA-binding CsgD family transcriptional regulator